MPICNNIVIILAFVAYKKNQFQNAIFQLVSKICSINFFYSFIIWSNRNIVFTGKALQMFKLTKVKNLDEFVCLRVLTHRKTIIRNIKISWKISNSKDCFL